MPAYERRSAALKHRHDASDIDGLTVSDARKINTTAPLTGGGDLSADRTLGITNFSASASGIVPASGGGTVNFLRADGAWTAPLTGAQGPAGPPVYLEAEPGDDGQPGPPGRDGAAGATGAQGPLGPAIYLQAEPGDDGERGATGSPGATGLTGSQGPVGPPVYLEAEQGDDGQIGPPGLAGPAGASGTTGASGPAGPAIFLEAEPAEDAALGPPGNPGATGVTGAQGPIGPPVYLEAEQGDEGPQGSPGNPGATGLTGAQGPVGPPIYFEAEPGEEGAFGPPGNPAATGLTGAQGPAGPAIFLEAEPAEDTATMAQFAQAGSPSALLGLTAIVGSAYTFMRSDGAPALDQSIAPTWTGLHTFARASGIQVRLNQNATALQAVSAGTLLQVGAADGVAPVALVDGYAATPTLRTRRANNTAASPAAMAANDILGLVQFLGYQATGYSGGQAQLQARATEAWTDTASGAQFRILVTPTGGVAVIVGATFENDGGLFMPGATGSSQGLGTINAKELYVNGVPVSPALNPRPPAIDDYSTEDPPGYTPNDSALQRPAWISTYKTGPFEILTGQFGSQTNHLQLVGSERGTIRGTGRLSISN